VQAVYRFLQNPAKPVVLAMSRPDAKKNITTLVKAFGENQTLRDIANLVLIMGNRSKIDSLAKGSKDVLTTVLKLIDEYDLYGSVAYPKAHTQVRRTLPARALRALNACTSRMLLAHPALPAPSERARACTAPIPRGTLSAVPAHIPPCT
jgi:hypothetical protein